MRLNGSRRIKRTYRSCDFTRASVTLRHKRNVERDAHIAGSAREKGHLRVRAIEIALSERDRFAKR